MIDLLVLGFFVFDLEMLVLFLLLFTLRSLLIDCLEESKSVIFNPFDLALLLLWLLLFSLEMLLFSKDEDRLCFSGVKFEGMWFLVVVVLD